MRSYIKFFVIGTMLILLLLRVAKLTSILALLCDLLCSSIPSFLAAFFLKKFLENFKKNESFVAAIMFVHPEVCRCLKILSIASCVFGLSFFGFILSLFFISLKPLFGDYVIFFSLEILLMSFVYFFITLSEITKG